MQPEDQLTAAVDSIRFDELSRLLISLDSRWSTESGSTQLVALSARWTLTGEAIPHKPVAYLDFSQESAARATLYQMSSGRGVRWEVHLFEGSLIAEGGDLEALGTAAEMLVDDLNTMLASYRRAFERVAPGAVAPVISAQDSSARGQRVEQ